MIMSAPRVSFIICTYNRDVYIRRSMESVAHQDADGHLFELVLVNNKSTDRTDVICREFAAAFPHLAFTYVIEENQGLSHARNRGIKEAKGDILVYLDDDAFAEKDFVREMISFYDAHPQVQCTGGKTIPLFEDGKPKWMSHFLMPLVAAVDLGSVAKPFSRTQFPIGANMAIRRAAIEEVGLFDTALGRKGKNLQGGEEKDMFNRIRAKGHQPWYLPTTVAHHIIPASRMTVDYIRKQARGIGFSEAVRTRAIGYAALGRKHMAELMKWIASMGLFLYYLICLQPQKATFLLRFRWWVSQGLFWGKE